MFKIFFKCFEKSTQLSIEEAGKKLQDVCIMLQDLIKTYEKDIILVKQQCRASIDRKESKQARLYYIKKIKMIQYHQDSARKRLLACSEKQYHLENVNVVAAHVDAIKTATNALGSIMKESDIEKVEELQDKLSDLITNAVEIQNIVSDDSALEFDEAELESELEELSKDTRYWPEVRLSTSDHEDSGYIDPSVPLIAPPVPVSPHRQLAALA